VRVAPLLVALGGCFGNCSYLQLDQAGDGQAQPHTTEAEHGVGLVQTADGRQEPFGVLVRVAGGPRYRDRY
jgi:hypothetical protein